MVRKKKSEALPPGVKMEIKKIAQVLGKNLSATAVPVVVEGENIFLRNNPYWVIFGEKIRILEFSFQKFQFLEGSRNVRGRYGLIVWPKNFPQKFFLKGVNEVHSMTPEDFQRAVFKAVQEEIQNENSEPVFSANFFQAEGGLYEN